MSKKKANSKSDLKKVLDRNRPKEEKVAAKVDMQMEAEEEVAIIDFDDDSASSSEDVQIEPTGNPKTEQKEDGVKQVAHPLSEEEKEECLEEIRERWPHIKTKESLLSILNVALTILYGRDARKLTLRMLNYYAYSSHNKKRYISFQVPKKKKGEFRTIDAPCAGLKMIQRALNLIFQTIYTPHEAAMGFVPHRSVVTNARVHVGQKYVYNIDLKDFFPSITSGRLFKRLLVAPFSMDKKMASIVTDLCCYTNADGKNVLPQGAPTSPTITNFISEHLDRKLSKLARAYGMKYTRYADDITFSCSSNMFAEDGRFCKSLHNIIENEEHFKINADKTRLCHSGERQEVTGLTVNEQTNVTRKYVKQIRLFLHIWEAKGLPEAQRLFEKHYTPKTTRPNVGIPHIENVIAGKLLYLKMVKGEKDETYRKLNERLLKLFTGNNNGESVPTNIATFNNKNYLPKQDSSSLVEDLNASLDAIINNYG
ncbi:MAG: reverse transcriptase family protein [Bacteroidales bacterium]|nr:reverse transcriptase family protein [Bacteroidales bacterium]